MKPLHSLHYFTRAAAGQNFIRRAPKWGNTGDKLTHQTKQKHSQLSTQTTKNQPHLNPGVAKPNSTFLPDTINANKAPWKNEN